MFKRSQQHWSPEQCPEFLLQPLALTVPSAQGEEQWQDPKQHWEGSWCIPGNSLGSGTLVWWVRVVGWLVSCRKRVVQSLPSWQRFLASHGDTFGLMRHQAQHYKKPMSCSWLRHAHGRVSVLRSTQGQAVLNCKFREPEAQTSQQKVQLSFFLPE